MKQFAVWGVKMVWVAILLLKLLFAFGLPSNTSATCFIIEFSECETEDTEKLSADGLDEFFQEEPYFIRVHLLINRHLHAYLIENAETHIREIVPPPPQV